MPDVFVALVILLVLAVVWRGPKTIPQIGAMFGRGVRAARDEANRMKADDDSSSDGDTRPEA